MQTLYDMLDVRPDDDAEGLRQAFRKAVKASHPDIHTDDPDAPRRFRHFVQAYNILRDPELRADYDRLLEVYVSSSQLELLHDAASSPPMRLSLPASRS